MIAEMGIAPQKTLKSVIHCRGVGLHSGVKVGMRLVPADVDTGIVFRRIDAAASGAEIRADWKTVVDSSLCTTLGNGEGITVGTVEHLMSALAGMEIDNVVVELDGPEVPAMDGSAAPFVFLIECAGIAEQDAPRRAIKILKPITVGDEERSASLVPDDVFSLSFEIDFPSAAVRHQDISLVFDSGAFKSDVARARTFGFLEDVDRMRAAGLALGGSLDNAVVVSGDRVLNEGGLRYADEFVRHKLLDAVGDLALAGAPIIGHFRGVRSSHAMTRQLIEALFADPTAWCETTLLRGTTMERAAWAEPVRVRA
jgi:UDP-3-O-[3-hydroxymyristoyl] N-acetylglucosamine deacetylase